MKKKTKLQLCDSPPHYIIEIINQVRAMGLDQGLTIVAQVKWPVGENWDWLKKHSQGTALSWQ